MLVISRSPGIDWLYNAVPTIVDLQIGTNVLYPYTITGDTLVLIGAESEMTEAGSRGTSLGMKRYWRKQPLCGRCKAVRLVRGNRAKIGICLKCEREIRKTGCVCTFIRHMGNGRYLTSNMDACPIHGFGEK